MHRLAPVLLLCFVVAVFPASAEESLEAFVKIKSDEILTLVNDGRGGFEADPGPLYAQMGTVLDGLVDFEILTRGIMGKHYKSATEAQRVAFQQALRVYLTEIYTKALVKFKSKSIEILPLEKAPTSKATISMEVTTQDNATFLLAYSMAKTGSAWLVRNIVVDGINMGLTYRSQFDSMMISNNNDIDAVIENWAMAADAEELAN